MLVDEVVTQLPDPTQDAAGQFHRLAGDTERGAALSQLGKSGNDRRRVLAAIGRANERGMTDEELSQALNLRLYTAAPRRNELLNGGWIMDSRQRRRTTTGAKAIVWTLTPQGRESWERS